MATIFTEPIRLTKEVIRKRREEAKAHKAQKQEIEREAKAEADKEYWKELRKEKILEAKRRAREKARKGGTAKRILKGIDKWAQSVASQPNPLIGDLIPHKRKAKKKTKRRKVKR